MRTDESGAEWVNIKHPTTGGEAEVTRTSFDDLWEAKGWVLNEDKPSTIPGGESAVVATYEANTVPELEAEIDRRGLGRTGLTLKSDLIDVLEDDDRAPHNS